MKRSEFLILHFQKKERKRQDEQAQQWTNTGVRYITPAPHRQLASHQDPPPLDPTGHRGNIPDPALFHNSHHVWFFQSCVLAAWTVVNPTEERRSDPCNCNQI